MRHRTAVLQALALVLVGLVLLAIAFARPDTTRVRLAEVSHPNCPWSGTQAAVDHATVIASGTATRITDAQVTITPDHYFFGDPAWSTFPIVIDRAPASGMSWTAGQRYFVFGEGGSLLQCAATQSWSRQGLEIIQRRFR